MKLSATLGGLAGACTLTVMNETTKQIDKAGPHLDLLGMNAVAKLMKGVGMNKPQPGKVMPVTMTSDLISSTLYFGMAGGNTKKQTLLRGGLLGLAAGIGAVALAKPLGLDGRAAEASFRTKALTVASYIVGGLVAAAVTNLLSKEQN